MTQYILTAFRAPVLDPNMVMTQAYSFIQMSTDKRHELIEEWAQIMFDDTIRPDNVPLYSVIIHIDGHQVFVATTDDVDSETDDTTAEYTYKDAVNQIIADAADEHDGLLEQHHANQRNKASYAHTQSPPGR